MKNIWIEISHKMDEKYIRYFESINTSAKSVRTILAELEQLDKNYKLMHDEIYGQPWFAQASIGWAANFSRKRVNIKLKASETEELRLEIYNKYQHLFGGDYPPEVEFYTEQDEVEFILD